MRIPDLDEFNQKPLGVSWSRLYEWSKCQQAAVFHYEGKGDTVKDGRRFIHGTLADRAMRRWLEQAEEDKPGQMVTYVDELWDEVVEKNPEYKITWKGNVKEDKARVKDIATTVVKNVEPFLFKRVLPYEYQPEFRFRTPLKVPDANNIGRTLLLNGGMDILVRESEDRYSIYDLKATTNENYVHQGIMPQLIFYSIAATYLFGIKSDNIRAAFLTPFNKVQYHPVNINADDRRYLLSKIIEYAQFMWAKTTPKLTNDMNQCFFCDCKSICPLWKTEVERTDNTNRISLVDVANARKLAKTQMQDKNGLHEFYESKRNEK